MTEQTNNPISIQKPISVEEYIKNQQPRVQPSPFNPTDPAVQAKMVEQVKAFIQSPEMKEKFTSIQQDNIANERAAREPIPSVVNEAFINESTIVKTSVGDVTIRKMVGLDVTIFKLTDSPFYKLYMGDVGPQTDKDAFKVLFPSEEIMFQLVYQFMRPALEIYREVKKDKLAYNEKVIEEVGAKYQIADVVKIVEVIAEHIGSTNQARVGFDAPETNDGEDKKKQLKAT